MPPSSSSFNCITFTLLVLPAVVLALYLLTSFPHVPETVAVHPSLASLVSGGQSDLAARVGAIYPEAFWAERASAEGGGYVSLPFGRTRYWIIGPEDGMKIVLIHGLSVPSIIWKDIAPELARRGYRVLLYDLCGRGYSDAPQVTYSASLYGMQLALLMQYVGWDKTGIVGISMGGGVATAFSVQFPHLVTGKVALLASAGIIEATDMSRTSRFLSSPLMQLVTSSYPFRMYMKHLVNTSNASVPQQHNNSFSELIRIQSAHLPGYNLALASSIRDGPIRNLAPSYVQLGRQTKQANKRKRHAGDSHSDAKVLLVWGTRDRVVPYHYSSRVLTLLGGAPEAHETFKVKPDYEAKTWAKTVLLPVFGDNPEQGHAALVTIEGAGHDLTVSHPELITELLVRFFGHDISSNP